MNSVLIVDLKEIVKNILPDYFVIAETKLDESFPSNQFKIDDYEIRNRKDRNKNGGGLIEYVRKGVICRETNKFCLINHESVCSELTIRNKKWLILSVYRPPKNSNLKSFFEELISTLNKVFSKYENVIVMGDINIDFHNPQDIGLKDVINLCETFNLTDLIKDKTCFTSTHQSSIDALLTNRSKSFQHSFTVETGRSDYHHMIVTFLKAHLVRLKPKTIFYRSYKNFGESSFLADVKKANLTVNSNDPDKTYEHLVSIFKDIVENHAPLKQKIVRGNHAPFMNRELSKAIYTRSRFKNNVQKNPTIENKLKYKKQRNKCVNLRKKAIKLHFKSVTVSGIIENNKFWETIKPFITNKNGLNNNSIILNKDNKIITQEKELVNIFNDHYINIVERSTGIAPTSITNLNTNSDEQLFNIINKFKNHPSIIKIKQIQHPYNVDKFVFKNVDEPEIKNLLSQMDVNVSTGEDKIPPKLVKLAKKNLVKRLTKAINISINSSVFPKMAKRAAVSPLDKGGKDKTAITNFRPVSVLNVFSKFYERIMKNQINSFI